MKNYHSLIALAAFACLSNSPVYAQSTPSPSDVQTSPPAAESPATSTESKKIDLSIDKQQPASPQTGCASADK
ncbi:hypothetical protein [Chamaesiphon polymorphus]|uniref:Uncharacterized protein n=1 Tax=Chamaesiphon polymorphus CCALA 037 TaxID=2107692 RepID=A0A2T1GCB1_9CYAN|nr:hypothetical protein [Chamaesiphon polymorphus]PSB54921.1 hypothetical protein C7B77_16655 [Chamaesiphon polymorphus CCALA 037]